MQILATDEYDEGCQIPDYVVCAARTEVFVSGWNKYVLDKLKELRRKQK